MALIAQLSLGLGGKVLNTVEVKRRGPYGPKGSEKPDDMFRYIVRVDDMFVGHVMHRYGDDAMTLILLAILRYKEWHAGYPDPHPDE